MIDFILYSVVDMTLIVNICIKTNHYHCILPFSIFFNPTEDKMQIMSLLISFMSSFPNTNHHIIFSHQAENDHVRNTNADIFIKAIHHTHTHSAVHQCSSLFPSYSFLPSLPLIPTFTPCLVFSELSYSPSHSGAW